MYYACIIHVNSGELYVHVNEILNQLKSITSTVALIKSNMREWFNNTNAISCRKRQFWKI